MTDELRNVIGGTQDLFYSRTSSAPLPMMARAEGIWFWDEQGKAYIDASSGPMVSAVGHCNPRVIDAMVRQARTRARSITPSL
jgi:4-aminobutyrate aminotransferase-like enzyme